MKPSLQLRVGQQLTLTPQLKQAIRLLTLSTLELQNELSVAVETNPMLEWDEAQAREPPAEKVDTAHDPSGDETEAGADDDWREADGFDLPDFASVRPGEDADEDGGDARFAAIPDLHDHLLWQLHLSQLSPRDLAIAQAIVEALDEDGYLHEPDEAIIAAVAPEHRVGADEVAAVRHYVQQLEPVGVASRDLRECLTVQLQQFPDDAARALALRIVAAHLEPLARQDRGRLVRELGIEESALEAASALVRRCAPKPGARFASIAAEHVVPDVYVYKRQVHWEVGLNPAAAPRLRVNDHYVSLLRRCGRDEGSALRGQLQEARWLLKSLEQRDQTVLKVARVIVGRQQDYFERGPEAMKPMVLREVAEEIGMHESTVSRVTTRKYMHTPRGTLEFKYFFSSHVATRDGGEASSTAIQAMIKKLIDEETPQKPLSDSSISDLLKRRGILVARRTVAKYREALRIPSSNERVRAG
ncbi:MAG: RNA polymerase factor sigma-54 [Xanthomonadales bacterium]|nr:RNA polymerase factor sigma-54 [Xanthomonadales bacterium]MCE7929862.1 RNA polymerase factor sigma-54 [Xanthomonadales bacterium PRO6]